MKVHAIIEEGAAAGAGTAVQPVASAVRQIGFARVVSEANRAAVDVEEEKTSVDPIPKYRAMTVVGTDPRDFKPGNLGVENVQLNKKQSHCEQCPFVDAAAPTRYQSLRMTVHMILESPTSSKFASLFNTLLLLLIIFGVLSVFIETLVDQKTNPMWRTAELALTVIFTAEFLSRIWSSKIGWRLLLNIANVVDLVSILPFYLKLVFPSDPYILNIFRIFRAFRALHIINIRYPYHISIITTSLAKSSDALYLLIFLLGLVTIVSSSMIYYAERGTFDTTTGLFLRSDGKPTPYTSIPFSMYWAVVTICAVGYGDLVPLTGPGQFVAGLTAISGILIIALPIAILEANFCEAIMVRNDKQPKTKYAHGDNLIRQHIYAIRYHRKALDYRFSGVRELLGTMGGTSMQFRNIWSTIEVVIISGLHRIEQFLTLLNEHRLTELEQTMDLSAFPLAADSAANTEEPTKIKFRKTSLKTNNKEIEIFRRRTSPSVGLSAEGRKSVDIRKSEQYITIQRPSIGRTSVGAAPSKTKKSATTEARDLLFVPRGNNNGDNGESKSVDIARRQSDSMAVPVEGKVMDVDDDD